MKLSDHSSSIAKINIAKRCFATNERFRPSKLICERSIVKNTSLKVYDIRTRIYTNTFLLRRKRLGRLKSFFIEAFTSGILNIFSKRLVPFGKSFIIRNVRRRKRIFWLTILYLNLWIKIFTERFITKNWYEFWTYDLWSFRILKILSLSSRDCRIIYILNMGSTTVKI